MKRNIAKRKKFSPLRFDKATVNGKIRRGEARKTRTVHIWVVTA